MAYPKMNPDGTMTVPYGDRINGAMVDGLQILQPGDPLFKEWLPFLNQDQDDEQDWDDESEQEL